MTTFFARDLGVGGEDDASFAFETVLAGMVAGDIFDLTGDWRIGDGLHTRTDGVLCVVEGPSRLRLDVQEAERGGPIFGVSMCDGVRLTGPMVLDGQRVNFKGLGSEFEAQHGLFLSGVTDFESEWSARNVAGDGAYLRHHRNGGVVFSEDVTLRGDIEHVGRHGIGAVGADGVDVSCGLRDTGGSGIDLEPETDRARCRDWNVHECGFERNDKGPVNAQGDLGVLSITDNEMGTLVGRLHGSRRGEEEVSDLVYARNVATRPKGDGSSHGLQVMGFRDATVEDNVQSYDSQKKNYHHFVKAQNVDVLRVTGNQLDGLKGHGWPLERGKGLGEVVEEGNVT